MPLALAACVLGACMATDPDSFTFEWTTSAGETWEHQASIERPAEGDTGMGVMLFGGGLSSDLHWTTPAVIEHEGSTTQLTIDGRDTRDADTLAEALIARGFSVLRYSAIRIDDPLHASNRAMAQAEPFHETVMMARAAWASLVERSGLRASEIIVVGHSLGAARAVLVTGGEAAAYVMLAGAYASPTIERPSTLAAAVDDNAPNVDYDASGDISPWERAAASALRGDTFRSDERLERAGKSFEWPSDTLARTRAPVLAIWGGLDTMSYHGPVLEHLLGERVQSVYFAELGHNLGQETEDGRTGPMDERVVELVARWAQDRARERSSEK